MDDKKRDITLKEGPILRILKVTSNVDWKSIAMVVTVLGTAGGGAAGYIIDWLDDIRTSRAQGAAYDILATRLEELSARVETCENAHNAPLIMPIKIAKPATPEPAPVSVSAGPAPIVETSADTSNVVEEEVVVVYEKSRLPKYDQIEQKAQMEASDLEAYMEQVKKR